MREIRRRRLDNAVWIPLRASQVFESVCKYGYLDFREQFFGVGSIAVPLDKKTRAETGARGNNNGGANRGSGYRNASYGGHGGRTIPVDRFRASFGHAHMFHMGQPIMIGGQLSFQFGGFWFGLADAWPAGWLYTDAVYIDYVDDGYFLFDVVHPDVRVAVAVGDAVTGCPTDAPTVAAPAPAAVVTVAPAPAVVASAPVVVRPAVGIGLSGRIH